MPNLQEHVRISPTFQALAQIATGQLALDELLDLLNQHRKIGPSEA